MLWLFSIKNVLKVYYTILKLSRGFGKGTMLFQPIRELLGPSE